MTGAAFFDLDKTLIEGSSALHFARAAYKNGMLSRRQLAKDAWANVRFRLQRLDRRDTDALRQRILDAIAGQRVVDLARLGPDVLAGDPAAALPRDAARGVRRTRTPAGRPTSSPRRRRSWPRCSRTCWCSTAASACARRCATASTPAARRARSPTARARPRRSASWPQREGIDLAESYAYSDSESDLPMLRAVGHPVAVNPDAALEQVARAEGWRDHALRPRSAPCCRSAAAALAVALVGGGGGYAAARLRAHRPAAPPAAAVEGHVPRRRSRSTCTRAPSRSCARTTPAATRCRRGPPTRTSGTGTRRWPRSAGRSSTRRRAWTELETLVGRARQRRDDPPHRVPHARAGPARRRGCAGVLTMVARPYAALPARPDLVGAAPERSTAAASRGSPSRRWPPPARGCCSRSTPTSAARARAARAAARAGIASCSRSATRAASASRC